MKSTLVYNCELYQHVCDMPRQGRDEREGGWIGTLSWGSFYWDTQHHNTTSSQLLPAQHVNIMRAFVSVGVRSWDGQCVVSRRILISSLPMFCVRWPRQSFCWGEGRHWQSSLHLSQVVRLYSLFRTLLWARGHCWLRLGHATQKQDGNSHNRHLAMIDSYLIVTICSSLRVEKNLKV